VASFHAWDELLVPANYAFVVDFAFELLGEPQAGKPYRLLDFGCGEAHVVRLAVMKGFDAHGADIFYDQKDKAHIERQGLLGNRVFEIGTDGRLPFADGEFDIVTSNMVFEHVDDFERALSEIARVLKRDGLLLALFPTRDVWHEGHIDVPFAHWFSKSSRWRVPWGVLYHALGFGVRKRGTQPPVKWIPKTYEWIDHFTYYRTKDEVSRAFGAHFSIATAEDRYLHYRLSRRPQLRRIAGLTRLKVLKPLLRYLCSRLGTRVYVLTKKG
jgi:SAM-dependent methyltransferase